MPHNIQEWYAFLGIAGIILSAVGWYVKKVIIEPLLVQIKALDGSIGGLRDIVKSVQNDYSKLKEQFVDMEKRLFAMEKEFKYMKKKDN